MFSDAIIHPSTPLYSTHLVGRQEEEVRGAVRGLGDGQLEHGEGLEARRRVTGCCGLIWFVC